MQRLYICVHLNGCDKLLCIKNAQQLGVGNREWGIGTES